METKAAKKSLSLTLPKTERLKSVVNNNCPKQAKRNSSHSNIAKITFEFKWFKSRISQKNCLQKASRTIFNKILILKLVKV